MCDTCGCNGNGNENNYKIYKPGKIDDELKESLTESHHHSHSPGRAHHDHNHLHNHDHESHTINIGQDILGENNMIAERNRGYFEAKEILALNLVSSPGSGKTSLLEKTIKALSDKIKCYVIEGDQQTDNDARRIAATGAEVLQINTGNACHLDAHMVNDSLNQLKPAESSVLFIENVGNLVCPALFDLGEKQRILIFSVTEGEDKPLKYPNMFHTSDICIINKTDLLPYLDFNLELAKQNVLKINPEATIIELSAKTGEGMDLWINWIKNSNILDSNK